VERGGEGMSWRDEAKAVLRALDLRKDDPEARRKVFDAYPFGAREYTPYKVWCEEVRRAYPWLRNPKAGEHARCKQGVLL